jgi:hypothetical protein
MPASPFATAREHRRARAAAERHRAAAEREVRRLRRLARRELRTTAVVTRAKVAEAGVRGVAHLLAGLGSGRRQPGWTGG